MPLSKKQRQQFDSILQEIIAAMPEQFRSLLGEVPVVVDDEPPIELLRELGTYEPGEPSDLCGMHSGPSFSSQAKHELVSSTPLIQIFRGPISRLAGKSAIQLKRQIRITLVHEIGHHFDFSEDQLHERGFG